MGIFRVLVGNEQNVLVKNIILIFNLTQYFGLSIKQHVRSFMLVNMKRHKITRNLTNKQACMFLKKKKVYMYS